MNYLDHDLDSITLGSSSLLVSVDKKLTIFSNFKVQLHVLTRPKGFL
jgi:hypothetical protein